MKSVLDFPHFHDEEAAIAYVEARLWPHGPVCRHCGTIGQARQLRGKTTRPGLWKCYACRKTFTVRMGTVFESSHVPLRIWLQAFHLMASSKKGISTRQLQRTLQCGMKTAWFLGHRIREAMKERVDLFAQPMGGAGRVVEADETYIGRSAKSKAFLAPGPKLPVMALVERGGKVRAFHVPNVSANNLRPIIGRHVHADSRFMTDESQIYTKIGWNFAEYGTVRHKANEYVRGDIYTNTVEGFFSVLKRGVYGVYQHVSEEHLSRYLTEFSFRYSHRVKLGIDDVTRADLALKGAPGRRLTYRTTRGRGAEEEIPF
jgi:transposase-like protein